MGVQARETFSEKSPCTMYISQKKYWKKKNQCLYTQSKWVSKQGKEKPLVQCTSIRKTIEKALLEQCTSLRKSIGKIYTLEIGMWSRVASTRVVIGFDNIATSLALQLMI